MRILCFFVFDTSMFGTRTLLRSCCAQLMCGSKSTKEFVHDQSREILSLIGCHILSLHTFAQFWVVWLWLLLLLWWLCHHTLPGSVVQAWVFLLRILLLWWAWTPWAPATTTQPSVLENESVWWLGPDILHLVIRKCQIPIAIILLFQLVFPDVGTMQCFSWLDRTRTRLSCFSKNRSRSIFTPSDVVWTQWRHPPPALLLCVS